MRRGRRRDEEKKL